MSIYSGKNGYNAIQDFTERTEKELRELGAIFKRDTEPPEHEVEFVREHLRGRDSVLELGCGLGPWAGVATDLGVEYVGVDPVRARIEFAREHWELPESVVTFIWGDARNIVLSQHFDTVLIVTVLQHLTLPDAIAVLRTASEYLELGGIAILIESRIWDISEKEAEERYASGDCADHMIYKPLQVLANAVPSLRWIRGGGREDRFILEKIR